MIKAVVIDDEKPSREVLCNYINEYCPEISVVATATSIKSGFRTITAQNPDLVFLDIELGDGKGFELLKMFDKISFKVIFVTAYSEYAVTAFRFSAVDYLLKPVKIDELREACQKLKTEEKVNPGSDNLTALINNLNNNQNKQHTLVIPHLKGFEVLRINDIIMCRADGYCTNFHLTDKRKFVSSKNLKYYEELLNAHNFSRVHHSYIVNLNHVTGYTKQGEIMLSEKNSAFLGDSYKSSFLKSLLKK